MQSDENTISTIQEQIFDRFEFDPQPHAVEQNHLNGCHHISALADDTSYLTNDDNIPGIITGSLMIPGNTTSSIEINIIPTVMTSTAARIVARTRMGTHTFSLPDAHFVEPRDMDV